MEENENENDDQKIEIVTGDGTDLDISPVSTHIPASKPKIQEGNNKKIIIPKEENN